jgi:hypothetical protein
MAALRLSREQILAHRRRTNDLDRRLPPGDASFVRAAQVGLQDSMPRAALLSIHARVSGTRPDAWEQPVYVQLWGPRFSAYVVAANDRAVFTLGRYPDDARGRQVADETASRLATFLDGRRMRYGAAGAGMGVHGNSLRYAAPTGTVLMRWEGARQPVIWCVPAPRVEPLAARTELARRYLHLFGPTRSLDFAKWAGIGAAQGKAAFDRLAAEMVPAETPIGQRWILAADETSYRSDPYPPAPARLLPSGDAYYLLWGDDRAVLVPDAARRALLWTSRVWPGALLVDGEVAGTWRRDQARVSVQTWRRFSPGDRHAVEEEAASLPLPDSGRSIEVRWEMAP